MPFPSWVALPRALPLCQLPQSSHSSFSLHWLESKVCPTHPRLLFAISGVAHAFPSVWILPPPIVCLLRSRFSSSPKAQLLCDLLLWPLWTASFQLVSPSVVCAPLLTCPSSVCQSTCPGLSVFCQLTATTQRIAGSCHTMKASRPSGSYTALPCILSATEPCLFSFPVCLVYGEMIPVLTGNTGTERTSAAGRSYPGVSIMPIYSPCCF